MYTYLSETEPFDVFASANLADIKSDLTILADNDLLNDKSIRTSAGILLSEPRNFELAKAACSLLGEQLWSPESQDFKTGLNNSLSYQTFLDKVPSSQLFWVSPNQAQSCRALDFKGHLSEVSCTAWLPTICTQSAPFSNSTYANTSSPLQLTLNAGNQTLTGYRDFYSFRFLGVRFAPQPQRFTYSTVYSSPSNTSAISYGSACLQPGPQGSEDCLFLNIWTPFIPSSHTNTQAKNLKPVLVWIFGGGFVTGTPNDSSGDGGNFASRGDIVVISINYRLGNLGMLALNDGVTNGNFGIGDMVTALQWIRENVAAFGGDPGKVTILGQSSGAAAVRALLASEMAKGLFGKAVMHSEPAGFSAFGPYSMYQTIEEEVKNVGMAVLNQTGCLGVESPVGCLKALESSVLVNLPVYANYPVIDGTYLTSPNLSFTTSASSSVPKPLLLGTVRDEGAITAQYPANPNLTLAMSALDTLLGLNLSPLPTNPAFSPFLPPNPTQNEIFNFTQTIITLGGLQCLTLATSYSASLSRPFPLFDPKHVFLYEFNRTYQPASFSSPACVPTNGNPEEEEYYKCHAGELIYVFGNLVREGLVDRDGRDVAFSRSILDRWASFVRTGDVNIDRKWLEARGFARAGGVMDDRWEAVGAGNQVRGTRLQWNEPSGTVIGMKGFEADVKERCDVLGLGLEYYET
ncbi:related to cholinesterase [Phialocephala subalpina]|uniref:Carboxylic ester hydrolase n=1 Tax=Phialocephala subalpina TaxID=576137 RepID=A0A1L7XEW4_9HELO|nr:related to cholinesterase [Phialocephala subalpina]